MLIIDQNLRTLAAEEKICDNTNLVEDFCIQIRLSNKFYTLKENKENSIIRYGYCNTDIDNIYVIHNDNDSSHVKNSITLAPGEQILACSQDKYKIPTDTFGLVQTKGSLARLFVQITCNDGQIEPGFEGNITLEIVNLSSYTIEIPFYSKIGQLYLFNCSMKTNKPYKGRYGNSEIPTKPFFNGFEG
ncbi:dCTP deaminase [Serratia marcescens]|uniref:dCTP deaminase n=1 Tax=Serratia marcescens TaxID=615 RepID=UPI0013D9AFBA|nr:deoxycytidine deaminase [Serratia marcescens]